MSSSLGPGGIVGGGSEWSLPLSKAPNSQLFPRHRSINGSPLLRVRVFTAVCVHFGWVNAEHEFREWVTILACMSLSLYILKICVYIYIYINCINFIFLLNIYKHVCVFRYTQ